MLQGLQLSALPQVAPYPIRNPPRLRSRLRARESPPPAPSFQVGDRVRVLRGCCQGLESTVTAIQPHLKHSIVLEPGKGRFPPDMLERVTAPHQSPSDSKKTTTFPPSDITPRTLALSCPVVSGPKCNGSTAPDAARNIPAPSACAPPTILK
jgi:hypothetical protein